MSSKKTDIIPPKLADYLSERFLRKKVGVADVARATEINNSYLHRIMNSENPVSIETSLRLAEFLGVDPFEIATVQLRRQIYDYAAARSNSGRPPERPKANRVRRRRFTAQEPNRPNP